MARAPRHSEQSTCGSQISIRSPPRCAARCTYDRRRRKYRIRRYGHGATPRRTCLRSPWSSIRASTSALPFFRRVGRQAGRTNIACAPEARRQGYSSHTAQYDATGVPPTHRPRSAVRGTDGPQTTESVVSQALGFATVKSLHQQAAFYTDRAPSVVGPSQAEIRAGTLVTPTSRTATRSRMRVRPIDTAGFGNRQARQSLTAPAAITPWGGSLRASLSHRPHLGLWPAVIAFNRDWMTDLTARAIMDKQFVESFSRRSGVGCRARPRRHSRMRCACCSSRRIGLPVTQCLDTQERCGGSAVQTRDQRCCDPDQELRSVTKRVPNLSELAI